LQSKVTFMFTRFKAAVVVALIALLAYSTTLRADDITEPRTSIVYRDAALERVCAKLSNDTSTTIMARGKTLGRPVTLLARNLPLDRVLNMLIAQYPDWLIHRPAGKPDTYEIWDQESFRAEVLPRNTKQKTIVLKHINSEDAYRAVQGLLTPNIGTSAFDPRTNKIFITDLPHVLELAERLIQQIDYKYAMCVFRIRKADVRTIAGHLTDLKSPAAPRPIVDQRTKQIIFFDRPEVIRQMRRVVEVLDI
jgi:type II secretory pathway component GspD/PulD (secretin)